MTLEEVVMTYSRFFYRSLAVVTLAGALATPASAQYFASPTGDDGNDCTSPASACRTIQAAIDKAPDGSQIHVASGSYAEEIRINGRRGLQILGEPEVEIVPPASVDRTLPVLIEVQRSTGIGFHRLTLSGDGTTADPPWAGFRFFGGQEIEITECTVQDLSGGGIQLFRHSNVVIRQSLIRRNRFHGVRVDRDTSVEITGAPFGEGTSILEDNPFTGVIVNGGSVAFLGSVVVRRNSIGVAMSGGEAFNCCGGSLFEVTENRSAGIQAVGGHLELRAPALVAGNGRWGLELYGATVETARFSSLEESVILRENGSADDPRSGGVFAASSSVDLVLAEVIGNASYGVLLQDNSSLRTYLSAIHDNGAHGIRAETLSTVRLVVRTTASGNGGADVSCDRTSVLAGETGGADRIQCNEVPTRPRGRP